MPEPGIAAYDCKFWKLKQEDRGKFKASLNCIASSCF